MSLNFDSVGLPYFFDLKLVSCPWPPLLPGFIPELCQFIKILKFPVHCHVRSLLSYFQPKSGGEKWVVFSSSYKILLLYLLLLGWISDINPYDDCRLLSGNGFCQPWTKVKSLKVLAGDYVVYNFRFTVTTDFFGKINCIHCSDQCSEL